MDAAAASLVALDLAGEDDEQQDDEEQQQQQQQAHAASALDICIERYMAAEETARLCSSSRALQQLCNARLSSELLVRSLVAAAQAARTQAGAWQAAVSQAVAAAPPLSAAAAPASASTPAGAGTSAPPPAAAAAAAAAPAATGPTSLQALRWLLRQPAVTAATINQCGQQLLDIPGVPLAAAEAVVRAGLRVQITGLQLVVRAIDDSEGLGVWVAAFTLAGVPLEEWAAADLPAYLRQVCCYLHYGELTPDIDELVQGLTPGRAAIVLSVALNMAACGHPSSNGSAAVRIIDSMLRQPACDTMRQLPAESVKSLLSLAVLLHGVTAHPAGRSALTHTVLFLSTVPAAQQLPTAALVEMARQAVATAGADRVEVATPILQLLAGRELSAEQAAMLLSLLRGPAPAAAAEAIVERVCQAGAA
uniref:Uncharacterized protein n=1 Tax=Tetradesmus obliquus TaxID=3088 RepID=A0A383W240_TETOB|eukprot:jgi/Sobl393_1/3987/SZX71199.1